MNGSKSIIIFLTVVFLLGYIFCSYLLFKEAFALVENPELSPNLVFMNVTSGLTGLVGGIVAAAFGVQTPKVEPSDEIVPSARKLKLQSLGSFTAPSNDEKQRERFGLIYSWAYMLVGLSAVIIWLYLSTETDDVPQNIANMGTTFLGMALAIVGAWLRPDA